MRLIIVSNRVALPDARKTFAGGLTVAVKAALRDRAGVWFGWSGEISEHQTATPRYLERGRVGYAVIDLSEADYQEYYNGFANRALWPVLHYRVDLQEYSRADQSGYMRVNSHFADQLDKIIEEDDVVWVHDYHLMPLARELRARGRTNPIGFFLHIPCAPPDILQTLPNHEEILGSLVHYDLVGFQTENDRDNFGRYLILQGARQGRGETYALDGRQTRLGAFPVGIETAVYARVARNAARSRFVREIVDSLNGQKLVLGVDRLDYSKGILHRLNAFDRFLELNPDWRQRVTFLQVTPKSREEIHEYVAIGDEVSTLIGKINWDASARRPGRRCATSTVPIRARRWPASIAPPMSRW